jgi:hypothetical protein
MSNRVVVFVLFVLACSPDEPTPSDDGSSGTESESTESGDGECQYCDEDFLEVLDVYCGDATSSLTVCEACCHSDALQMACQSACEMGDCAAACSAVEATPDRHQDCLDSCMNNSCSSACGYGSVDTTCEQACTDFLACVMPGNTCEQAEACMATACMAGA